MYFLSIPASGPVVHAAHSLPQPCAFLRMRRYLARRRSLFSTTICLLSCTCYVLVQPVLVLSINLFSYTCKTSRLLLNNYAMCIRSDNLCFKYYLCVILMYNFFMNSFAWSYILFVVLLTDVWPRLWGQALQEEKLL